MCRRRHATLLLPLAGLVLACCSTDDAPSRETGGATEDSGAAPVAVGTAGEMDQAITELMARPEVADERITVQHVLIAFKGAPRITGVSRSKDQAKQLAATIWQEAVGGADFETLMQQHSDDSGGGTYPMTKAGRRQMVAAFGDVGFRLKVGQIGVAPWDSQRSPYGWHVIKRIE